MQRSTNTPGRRPRAHSISATIFLALAGLPLAWAGCGSDMSTGAGGGSSTTSTTSTTTSGGPTCGPGTTLCGAVCAATQNDPAHCGSCDKACAEGEVCSKGTCGLVCLGGATKCGDLCVDTQNDPKNCGGCDKPCAADEVCSAGLCSLSCAGGATKCGSACVDLESDSSHCGACGNDCGAVCGAAGFDPCGVCFQGACLCDTGVAACDGACVSLETDPKNCGDCGSTCGPMQSCVDYSCVCPAGSLDCNEDGTCVDTQSDPQNCGDCGVTCDSDMTCAAGSCVPIPATVNLVASPASGAQGGSALTLDSAMGFAAGKEILVHQTQGAGAGAWEIATVASVAGNVLTLSAPLAHTYVSAAAGNDHAQAVLVEKYATLDVPAGSILAAPAWNGSTGGILAIHVTGAMTVEGKVTMNGRGYRGTSHPCTQMNNVRYTCQDGFSGESPLGPGSQSLLNNGPGGGGGSRGQDCGMGAAGSYGTAGEDGINNTFGNCSANPKNPDSAAGTVIGSADLTAGMFFGGAGGEGGADEDGAYPGKGGNGGGIVYLQAGTLTITGQVSSNGLAGGNGNQSACGGGGCGMSGGGGGAGGAIRIIAGTAALGDGLVTATGGAGGSCTCAASGASAGAGRIAVQSANLMGTTDPAPFGG
ncbi:MAG: hypothetical protein U0359_00820 [Byssovorax sp.]